MSFPITAIPGVDPWFRLSRSEYAARRAADVAEWKSMRRPCDSCGAPAEQLCYAPTGLPASGPCPGRVAAEFEVSR